MNGKHAGRLAACDALIEWLGRGKRPCVPAPCPAQDRAFAQDLLYTSVKRLAAARAAFGPFVSRKPDAATEAFLVAGAAQLLFMPGVPEFAAVHETVEAAKKRCGRGAAGFVNAVLRGIARHRAETEARLAAAPLHVRESHPEELVARWIARFGADGAERLAKRDNEPGETFLARPGGTFEKLARGRCVESEPGYAEGGFIVQDPGTAGAVRLLAPERGDEILDACAAPGGKAVQCAWRGAKVVACEPNPRRRERLAENVARTRLGGAVEVREAPPEGRLFRKVLADVPCSNSGVLGRRPDARWNWSGKHLAQVRGLQARILDSLAERVAPGGVLVYSTCSIEPEENGMQVAAFLERHAGFRFVRSIESLPHVDGCDGAFAARLERRGLP